MTQETTQHTPEPWNCFGPWRAFSESIIDDNDYEVLRVSHEYLGIEWDFAAAARIVACVNACAGMVDPAAEIAALKARIAQLEGGAQ